MVFSGKFSDKVDRNDAAKLTNSGENFGIRRDGKLLAIESRAPVSTLDTIYYYISNLRRQTYQLRFAPKRMNSTGLQAFLFDNYLKTETPVSLSDSSFINVNITADAASYAADRFKVYFRQMSVLPLAFISLDAKQNAADILVEWKVQNENNMLQYEVESSVDGSTFTGRLIIAAGNGDASAYQWTDKNPSPGCHYYRIKSIDRSGAVTFSPVVKALIKESKRSIVLYPNPVADRVIHLQMNQQPEGKFLIRLLDASGKALMEKSIEHTSENSTENIPLKSMIAHGYYRLEITAPAGAVTVINFLY